MAIVQKKVLEFDEAEIKKLIQDKAAELMGDMVWHNSTIYLGIVDEQVNATVTFHDATMAAGPGSEGKRIA